MINWDVKTLSPWDDVKPIENEIKKYHRMFWSNPKDVKNIKHDNC
jgi:hypothetical protein